MMEEQLQTRREGFDSAKPLSQLGNSARQELGDHGQVTTDFDSFCPIGLNLTLWLLC